MADISPRMAWPFPAENEDPWLEAFQDFVRASDASAFAAREDRNLILMGGGTVTWNGTTGLLTWTAAIEFLSPGTGFLNQVPAGNLTIADSQVIRGNVARALGANASMAVSAAGFALANDNSVLLAVRRGTQLYWRNGLLMANGDVVTNLGSTQGAGAVTLAGDVTGPSGTNVVEKIRGANVQAVAPTNGQILIYDGVDARWEPTTPAAPPTGETVPVERLVRTAAGTYKRIKDNLNAGVAPTVADNTSLGYEAGSIWVDQSLAPTNHVYIAAGEDAGDMIWLEVGAGGATSDFIWQPGGVASGNIYTTFATLHTAVNAITGPKRVFVDVSLGTADVPAGSWDIDGWEIYGNLSPGPNTPITVLDLAFFVNVGTTKRFALHNIDFRLDVAAAAPAFAPTGSTSQWDITLYGSNFVSDASPICFIDSTGLNNRNVYFYLFGRSGVGIAAVEHDTNTNAYTNMEAYDGSVISDPVVGTQGQLNYDLRGSDVFNPDPASFSGSFFRLRQELAANTFYDQTVVAITALSDAPQVQAAIDRQVGWSWGPTGGGSVINGPIDRQQAGTTELHIGSLWLPDAATIKADSRAMIGGSVITETGILKLRRFTGGALVASWTRLGTLGDQVLDGAADIGVPATDWYDLFLVAGGAGETAILKGLRLNVVPT